MRRRRGEGAEEREEGAGKPGGGEGKEGGGHPEARPPSLIGHRRKDGPLLQLLSSLRLLLGLLRLLLARRPVNQSSEVGREGSRATTKSPVLKGAMIPKRQLG